MIEFWLMRLNLREVPVVEITRLPQVSIPEDNDAATFIANCQILARLIEVNRCQNVCLRDLYWISLSEAIDVAPLCSGR